LWQQLLLAKENPIFKFVAVEELIKANQQEYYNVLSECDKLGDSTRFIEFSLNLILLALENYRKSIRGTTVKDPLSRLEYAKEPLQGRSFSRKEYMDVFKSISTATASRDLKVGVEHNILERTGDQSQSLYVFFK
jgi:Fic family protein